MDDAPPAEDPDDRAAEGGGEMIGYLHASPSVARWLGWMARRAGRDVELRSRIPAMLLDDFDEGAQSSADASFRRPPDVTDAQVRRVKRDLARRDDSKADAAPVAPVTIASIVRNLAGTGRATFTVTIACGSRTAILSRLTGAELGAYKTIRDLAVESKTLLPTSSPKARKAWDEALAAALPEAADAPPEIEEDPILAVRQEIVAILMGAEVGETEADMCRGMVVRDEPAACVYVLPRVLVSRVRARMPEDRPDREQIVDAARLLAYEARRPQLSDNRRPRVWAFPAAALDHERETT
jgi:hypothetical protein